MSCVHRIFCCRIMARNGSRGRGAMEGSLDEITSRFERSVLTQLYPRYPSTRKLAKRLGVSHTAIANKLREYGLSQKKNEE
ncbi:TyrR/PhhR family helix-turn-helix DNA-binding protein [Escherichia coli]|uniref:TyrR/PhhR family helix-turn-helix DNA-binding protein n=1 Tax=Escherichia coli TaxID=562 RepID=UPI0022381DDD|nr:TyrR/PhhR family helix-turn-helix DNA-binding protein [Escherichia coli]MCW7363686.1 transcriptional regulator [Escherichia coli]